MRLLLLLALTTIGCASKSKPAEPEKPKPSTVATANEIPAPNPLDYTSDLGDGTLLATLRTNHGDLTCELFEKRAPKTVANFVGLARGKKTWMDPETNSTVTNRPFYDGVTFSRVIPGFFIQTGNRGGDGTPGFTFPDETSPDLRHDAPGIMSMANTGPNTNGSQFFILSRPTPHLDGKHSIFGKCRELDVLAKIEKVPTDAEDRPEKPVVLERIVISRQ